MQNTNILLVEDDVVSLKLLEAYLKDEPYHIITACDGLEAMQTLQDAPNSFFNCIVSDICMPNMSGLELLDFVKQDPHLKHIPFILETADSDQGDIKRGVERGSFYYLIKPVTRPSLLTVIEAAINDYQNHIDAFKGLNRSLPLLTSGHFQLKTIEEAKQLANLLGLLTSDPESLAIGYFELILNGIEHGNLGISYDEKTQLIQAGKLKTEITTRLTQPEYSDKVVDVTIDLSDTRLEVSIKDMGKGFDVTPFLDFSLERAMDNHGRGIMMANKLSFDSLKYSENGTRVHCITHKLRDKPTEILLS